MFFIWNVQGGAWQVCMHIIAVVCGVMWCWQPQVVVAEQMVWLSMDIRTSSPQTWPDVGGKSLVQAALTPGTIPMPLATPHPLTASSGGATCPPNGLSELFTSVHHQATVTALPNGTCDPTWPLTWQDCATMAKCAPLPPPCQQRPDNLYTTQMTTILYKPLHRVILTSY